MKKYYLFQTLRYPQSQKSGGVRSGDLGGHKMGPSRPIQRPPNSRFSHIRVLIAQWGFAPS